MRFLYDLGIRLYYLLAWFIAPFNVKARLWIRGRKDLFQSLQDKLQGNEQFVWFHAASLGEFEQGRPLMEAWKKEFPHMKILLTFFSPSGYEIRKNYNGADYIFYLPLDTRRKAKRFIQSIKPEYVIFIKYEYCFHLLQEAKKYGSRIYLVSAIFRTDQLFFMFWGKWFVQTLYCFRHIFVQDEASMRLLNRFDNLSVSIAGDTRFDRVAKIASEAKPNEKVAEFTDGRFTFIVGSSWEKDEHHLIRYINENDSDACYVIAPHETNEAHIRQIIDRLHKKAVRYSRYSSIENRRDKVLIIDNIGLLSSLYRYADVAYIGGGFGKGIHNILEPAVQGIPVVFGPKYYKFREAVELKNEGGAFTVNTYRQVRDIFDLLRNNRVKLEESGRATRHFVQRNMGATDVIINYLKKN
jgi:3-deoxy-D-manno-octulosonic-acid transferase